MRNKIIKIDGITFRSIKEGRRYSELKLMERAGLIKGIWLQRQFIIMDAVFTIKKKPIYYYCDFDYTDIKTGLRIYEDVKGRKKGTQYDLFCLKAALVKMKYNIDIQEI